MRGRDPRSLIRMIGGAYVVYLGYQVMRDGVIGHGITHPAGWWAGLFGAAFLMIAGVVIVVYEILQKPAPKEEDGEPAEGGEGADEPLTNLPDAKEESPAALPDAAGTNEQTADTIQTEQTDDPGKGEQQ